MSFSSPYAGPFDAAPDGSFSSSFVGVLDSIPDGAFSSPYGFDVDLIPAYATSSPYYGEVEFTPTLLPAKQLRSASFTNTQVNRLFVDSAIEASKLKLTSNGGLKDDGSGGLTIEPNDFAGSGLVDDGSDNLTIDTASATVTFTGGVWTFPVDVIQVTGTPNSPNDGVNKAYVDNVATGLRWREPVTAAAFIGERTVAQINALTPSSGWAVVATDAGTPTAGTSDALAAGDLAEFDGTSWIKLFSNAAGQLPAGIRLLVAGPGVTLFSPLTGSQDEGLVLVSVADPGTFDGANSDFEDESDAVDGNALLVQGLETADAESVNENNGYVFDGAVPTGSWVQFTGAGQLNAGAGLSKTGNTLNIGDDGKGVQVNADSLQIDASEIVNTTSGLQQISGGGNEHLLELKLATGTPTGEAFSKDSDGLKLDGDLIDVTFNPSNYTPDITGNPGGAQDVDDLSAHLLGIDTAIGAASGTHRQESLTPENISGSDVALTDTLDAAPISDASLKLYLNGILQQQGAGFDYTISGQTITWLAGTGTAVDMDTGDVLIAVYVS